MKKIAACFLAYGDEHINEFNGVVANLQNNCNVIDIIVATDSPDKILNKNVKIIRIYDEFNYNQKLISIEYALTNYDTILFMDTDILPSNHIDFSLISNLADGVYPSWHGTLQQHFRKPLSIESILNGTSKFEDVNVYGKKLKEILGSNVNSFFMDEFLFILKISDSDTKKNYIKAWKQLHTATKEISPFDRYGNQNGSLEGIIISSSAYMANLNIFRNNNVSLFFKFFIHHVSNERVDLNKIKTSIL